MKVRIINLRSYTQSADEELVKVDRSNKVLGNPFPMKSEDFRAAVCRQHQHWFNAALSAKNQQVIAELERIFWKATQNNVALGCWCAPKECHSELYLAYIMQRLREEFPAVAIELKVNSQGRYQEFEWRLPNLAIEDLTINKEG